ncbi:YchF/TatD family DNA exonuclease [Buchnera aphidicola (Pemphigus obesinymphae)]|uniref:TatD family hydrolase n=1 Tax=Buchnera aphidicola TaxID=9 RepID=UPI002AA2B0D1|nr:YchF/TatD family DNA exonuclease [Buchnera aphidicola]MCW5196599.1 YchF/TatD family DNA exonuclease [Buchnera aphidicola (Pemphigus obesinymphae)]
MHFYQKFSRHKKKIGNYKNILYSCGIHPLYLSKCNKIDLKILKKLAQEKNVIALGETGLDYYYQKKNKKEQKYVFRKHIKISIELNKPVVVHTRESIDDTLSILNEIESKKCKGIIHSFTGNVSSAKKILDMGFYISFSGIITFKNADEIRRTAKYIPLDRLLIETDAPYLTPVPKRGKENQPSYLKYIADCIVKLRKINMEYFTEITQKNFYELFQLKDKK